MAARDRPGYWRTKFTAAAQHEPLNSNIGTSLTNGNGTGTTQTNEAPSEADPLLWSSPGLPGASR
jgi:hypothetical protein